MNAYDKQFYTKAERLKMLVDKQALHVCRVWIRIEKMEGGIPNQPRTADLRKQHEVAYTRLNRLVSYGINVNY